MCHHVQLYINLREREGRKEGEKGKEGACMLWCTCGSQWTTSSVLSASFETGPFFCSLAGLQVSGDSPISASHFAMGTLVLQMLYMGSGDSNSGANTCESAFFIH